MTGAIMKRWPSSAAARNDDGAYYTLEEWKHFFDDEAYAIDVWDRAVSKDEDGAVNEVREMLADDVRQLRPLTFSALTQGITGLVLAQPTGNSLRVSEGCGADFWGGAGWRATLDLMVRVKCACSTPWWAHGPTSCLCTHCGSQAAPDMQPDCLEVRVRSCFDGREHFLQSSPTGDASWDFRGSKEDAPNTVFKLQLESEADGLLTLSAKNGQFAYVFARSRVDEACWWRPDLARASENKMKDAAFQGRRRHPLDTDASYFNFLQWVEYIDQMGWGGPFVLGALVLGELMWQTECIPEEDDAWVELGSDDDYDMEDANGAEP